MAKDCSREVSISIAKNEWEYLGEFKILYYWAGENNVSARTCIGKIAQPNHTIAVDPNVIPLGSKVKIDGIIYTAEDVGGAIKGNIIDIFVDSPRYGGGKKAVSLKVG